jgi:hypothetical protein
MSDRKHLDQYYTPQSIADALVDWYAARYPWPINVIEPSSGLGSFCRAIRRTMSGVDLLGIDLEPKTEAVEVCDLHLAKDFLTVTCDEQSDLVIGNPPFSDAEAHIRHAITLVKEGGHVAFLLRLAFMESHKRADFWSGIRAREILVLRNRPSFTGGGTDSAAYGFFVFERGYRGATVIYPCWAPEIAEAAK